MTYYIAALLGDDKDEKIKAITDLTESRLCNMINVDTVPEELEYIVTEVAIARFNRIGSEGLSSHSVEGETMSWSDDDFEPFKDDIQAFISKNATSDYGRVRFL